MSYSMRNDPGLGIVEIAVDAVWVGDDALTPVADATVSADASTSDDPNSVGLYLATNIHQSFWRQEFVWVTPDVALALAQIIRDALAGPVPSTTVEAFTCEDDPQPIMVEVASAPDAFTGVYLAQWWQPVNADPTAGVIVPDVDDAAALADTLTAAAELLIAARAAA